MVPIYLAGLPAPCPAGALTPEAWVQLAATLLAGAACTFHAQDARALNIATTGLLLPQCRPVSTAQHGTWSAQLSIHGIIPTIPPIGLPVPASPQPCC